MLNQEQIQQFHRDGYLRGNRVLNDEQVDILCAEIERVIADSEKTDIPQPVLCHNMNHDPNNAVWQIVNIWEASAPFKDLVANKQIGQEMTQLTGASTLRIWHDQIQYKPAKIGGVNMWHQDAPLWPIIAPMTEVTAWVALDDVDTENGCMHMVPGSHTWGNHMDWIRHNVPTWDAMPTEFEGHKVEVRPCPVRRGEVHFHHALTWHSSPDNRSGRPRRALAIHFMTNETRYVASGNHVMKQFVEIGDGEVMHGEHFPQVWP